MEDVLVSTIIPFSFLKYIICVVVAKSIAGFDILEVFLRVHNLFFFQKEETTVNLLIV